MKHHHRRLIAIATALAAIGAGLTFTASPAGSVAGFGDVGATRFFTKAVQWMVDEDITTGTSPTCFSPNDPVTRGQAAAFMWRMEGEPAAPPHPFTDVVKDWQQGPVSWMAAANITTGTTPSTYSPEDPLTRGQMAALLWRLAGEPPAAGHPFTDVVKDWQQEPVAWMAEEGITTGTTPTTFSPDDDLTRAQAATLFYRFQGSPVVGVDQSHPTNPACAQQVQGPESAPTLTPNRTIKTRPFVNDSVKLFDGEGMAYLPVDGTIWLADDNSTADNSKGAVLHEIDADTGELLHSISIADLAGAPRFGGGPAAGEARASDLESVAYDPANDLLYAFSGTIEGGAGTTAAFRFTRPGPGATFTVESYQPMGGADGAASRPDGSLVIVQNDVSTRDDLHTYDYPSNTTGPGFSIPGIRGAIWGLGFSDDGTKLFIGNAVTDVYRVTWQTKTLDEGYRFSVAGSLAEPTAVEPVGDRVYFLDGDDTLATVDPLKYALHVFTLSPS